MSGARRSREKVMRVHVKKRDEPAKELTIEEVNSMLEKGQLDGDELAWTPGLLNWIQLRSICGVALPSPPPLPEACVQTKSPQANPCESTADVALRDFVQPDVAWHEGENPPEEGSLADIETLAAAGHEPSAERSLDGNDQREHASRAGSESRSQNLDYRGSKPTSSRGEVSLVLGASWLVVLLKAVVGLAVKAWQEDPSAAGILRGLTPHVQTSAFAGLLGLFLGLSVFTLPSIFLGWLAHRNGNKYGKTVIVLGLAFCALFLLSILFQHAERTGGATTVFCAMVVIIFGLAGLVAVCWPVPRAVCTGHTGSMATGTGTSSPGDPLGTERIARWTGDGIEEQKSPLHEGIPRSNEAPGAPSGRPDYFVRHWRGDVSLGVSFWLNAVLATILFVTATAVFGRAMLDEAIPLRLVAVFATLICAAALTLGPWQIIGVWRSASRHTSRGGRHIWAVLAKVWVVLASPCLVTATVTSIVPQAIEYVSIALGDMGMPPYEIRVLPDGKGVEFYGGLRAGCAAELRHVLDATPQAEVLHINSPGGRVREARAMARLVRDRGLLTYASDECLSAATLVFMSGKERIVSAYARIGFHSGRLPGVPRGQQEKMNAGMRDEMRAAGISEQFISRVLATSSKDMWYPSFDEMRQAGVVTSQSYGERFSVSGTLLRESSPAAIAKLFDRVPGLQAMKDLEPATYQTLVTHYSAAIQEGKSLAEVAALGRSAVTRLMLKYLPRASNEVLLSTRDFWIEILEKYKDRNSRACIAFVSETADARVPNLDQLYPDYPEAKAAMLLEHILRSGAAQEAIPVNAEQAQKDAERITAKLRLAYGDRVDLLKDASQWMGQSDTVCEILLALYRETSTIPQERQGNLLRYMVSKK
jgi:hypothetical protein